MAKEYVKKWKVPSSSNPDKAYTVSLTKEGAYECSCPTWIYRRQECHHVRTIKANPDLPAESGKVEPLVIIPAKVCEVKKEGNKILVPLIPLERAETTHLLATVVYDCNKLGVSFGALKEHFGIMPSEWTLENVKGHIRQHGRLIQVMGDGIPPWDFVAKTSFDGVDGWPEELTCHVCGARCIRESDARNHEASHGEPEVEGPMPVAAVGGLQIRLEEEGLNLRVKNMSLVEVSSGIDLAKQYMENKAKIEGIWSEDEKFREAKDKEIRELERAYRDKKWALEEEERTKVNAMQQEKEGRHEAARKQAEELHKVIEQVDRILYFLKLKPDITWKEEVLKAYEGKELVRLGALHQDEFLDMRLYVVENDRPKNKYTLVVKGRCAFGAPCGWEPSSILELPRAYGLNLNDYGAGDNVEGALTHLPTIDDVKRYVAKHSNELMREFLVKYRAVKREYLEALRTYKLEEFTGIEASSG